MPTLSPNMRITLHRLPMNVVLVCVLTGVLVEIMMPLPQQYHFQTGLIAVALLAVVARNILDFLTAQRSLQAGGGGITAPEVWLKHAVAAWAAQTGSYVIGIAFFIMQLILGEIYTARAVGMLILSVKGLHLIALHLSHRAFVTEVEKDSHEDAV